MNKLYSIIIASTLFFFLSCDPKQVKSESTDASNSELSPEHDDSSAILNTDVSIDSLPAKKSTQEFLKGKNLKTADYIKQSPTNQEAELIRLIVHLKEEWQNVPNPITATYIGNDFGDYHHILFKASNGVEYDFGQANNNYGEYSLFENSGQYVDHPDYLGKEFKVYWNWTLSEFYCCDGEYGKAKAYLPAITKLELIKK